MASDYVIQRTERSCCPTCGKKLSLLCDERMQQKPAFYICWNCSLIFEVGKGRVHEEDGVANDARGGYVHFLENRS